MNFLLVKNILAGQGDDGWTNILFVVVMAVFWVIGGIIKATNKKTQGSRKGPAPSKPVPKIPKSAWDRKPTHQRSSTPAQAPATKTAAHQRKIFRPESMHTVKRTLTPTKPQAERILENIPVIAGLSSTPSQPIQIGVPQSTLKKENLPELVLDYADSDELTKAILHYEILGPPVSLRESSHQVIAL